MEHGGQEIGEQERSRQLNREKRSKEGTKIFPRGTPAPVREILISMARLRPKAPKPSDKKPGEEKPPAERKGDGYPSSKDKHESDTKGEDGGASADTIRNNNKASPKILKHPAAAVAI